MPADDQGRIIATELPDPSTVDGPVLLCAQAGEVNTGAFDPFAELATVIDVSANVNPALRRWFEDEGRIAIERASAP